MMNIRIHTSVIASSIQICYSANTATDTLDHKIIPHTQKRDKIEDRNTKLDLVLNTLIAVSFCNVWGKPS